MPWADEALLTRIEGRVIAPAVAGLVAEGIDWRPGDNVVLTDMEHVANVWGPIPPPG